MNRVKKFFGRVADAVWFYKMRLRLRLQPNEIGAVGKILARGWTVEIRTGGTDETPTFTEVGGVNSVSAGRSKTNADTSDFASGGWDEHLPASRSRNLTVGAHFLEDVDTGDRDAGQVAVEDLADLVDVEGIGQLRFTSRGGNGFTANGSFDVSAIGGDRNAATSWGFTFDVSGAPTPLEPEDVSA